MWKPEHRLAADRRGLRYPSDLSDDEWALVGPMIPPANPLLLNRNFWDRLPGHGEASGSGGGLAPAFCFSRYCDRSK